jgi:hypothetical protein
MADTSVSRRGRNFKDEAGRRFGRLIVVEFAGMRKGHAIWRCRCDCGVVAIVRSIKLRSGQTRSCGCLRGQAHGLSHGQHSSIYNIWLQMIDRCTNPENHRFKDYGGRGIEVCRRWLDPANFVADMGPRPSPEHSIDRVDNDGPYDIENTRWATRSEQQRNRRANHTATLDGETLCVAAWAERLGMPDSTIRKRLRRGWSVRRALTEPAHR